MPLCLRSVTSNATLEPAGITAPSEPTSTPLAKILVLRPGAERAAEPPPLGPVEVDVDLDNLARGDATALIDFSRARPSRAARLLGVGLVGWILVVAYIFFVLRWMTGA